MQTSTTLRAGLVMVLVGVATAGLSPKARAGVGGRSYSGTIVLDTGPAGPSHMAFSTGTSCVYQEDLPGDPVETFNGTYTELDFVLFSFVDFVGQDGTADGKFDGEGFSLFGTILIMNFTNPDFSPDWTGYYFQSNWSPLLSPEEMSTGFAGQ